jgi:forkhead box protein K
MFLFIACVIANHTLLQNSVRHNLSSNRAFKKMERCAGERGKGFFWSVEEMFIPAFEEQEVKNAQLQLQQASGSTSPQVNGMKVIAGKTKKGAALSDPPLKRSVKAGSGPLPPPLTNTPLAMKPAPSPSPGSLASPYSPRIYKCQCTCHCEYTYDHEGRPNTGTRSSSG